MLAFVITLALVLPVPFQRAGYTVQGTLAFDTVHMPSQRLLVYLDTRGGRTLSSAYTDGSGQFAFSGIPGGTYYVRISLKGFQDVQQRIEVPRVGPLVLFMSRKTEIPPADGNVAGPHVVGIGELDLPQDAVREYGKAMNDLEDGDAESAIERLERAVKIAPQFFDAHAALATQYQEAGRTSDAEKHWRTAASIRNDPVPLIKLGQVYIELQNLDSAVEVLEQAIDRDPNNSQAVFHLSTALYENSDYDRAETVLTDFLRRHPDHGSLQLVLANVFIRQLRLQDAVSQIDLYLEQHPDGPDRASAIDIRKQLLNYLNRP